MKDEMVLGVLRHPVRLLMWSRTDLHLRPTSRSLARTWNTRSASQSSEVEDKSMREVEAERDEEVADLDVCRVEPI